MTEKLRRIEGSPEKGFGFKCKVPTRFGTTAADKGYNEFWGEDIPTLKEAMNLEEKAYKYLIKQIHGEEYGD